MSRIKNTKTCFTCKIQKPLNEFNYRSKIKKTHMGKCKMCQKEYQASRYKRLKKQIYTKNIERRMFLAKKVNEIKKNKPCVDCGKIYDLFCMDFDHLSNKIMSISQMIHETFSLKNIKKEIDKCELVCVLCHRNRTYQRLQEKEKKKQFACITRHKEIIYLAKSKPCAICNIQYDPWMMEFDHLRDKNVNVGTMWGNSDKKINEEINKCQVLCALCHRQKSINDAKSFKIIKLT